MTLGVLILAEDTAHAAIADGLTHAVLCEVARERHADWIADALSLLMRWKGEKDLEPHLQGVRYTPWPRAFAESDSLPPVVEIDGVRLKTRGHYKGQPLKTGAAAYRKALLWAYSEQYPLDAMILVKDTDGKSESLDGLWQVIDIVSRPIILAAPHRDAEAWFVAGLRPEEGTEESVRLEQIRGELSFDPCEEPHRLTSSPNTANTDAKRVLRRILHDEDASRPIELDRQAAVAERCFSDLALLRERGVATGLVAFLEQIEARLYPLLTNTDRQTR